jgi:hypothetical protein
MKEKTKAAPSPNAKKQRTKSVIASGPPPPLNTIIVHEIKSTTELNKNNTEGELQGRGGGGVDQQHNNNIPKNQSSKILTAEI